MNMQIPARTSIQYIYIYIFVHFRFTSSIKLNVSNARQHNRIWRVFMPFSFMLRRVADLGAMLLVLMTAGHGGGGAGWRGGQGVVLLCLRLQ